jgi:small subunit ribosomal protein S1
MNEHNKQDKMPVLNEDWWEALLTDEIKYVQNNRQTGHEVRSRPSNDNDGQNGKTSQLNWDLAQLHFKNDQIIKITVTGYNHGGLLVENDELSGFVPFSHLVNLAGRETGEERQNIIESYVGKKTNVKIIDCKPDEDRVVFSERAALSEPGKRVELFDTLEPGMQINGTITNITEFGAFVDLGGAEGLIHISELSWGRVAHPKQIVQLGDEVRVQVLEISVERCRVALSRKRMLPNPWENALEEFPEGRIVSATISNVLSYGAFANLNCGVQGLIHAKEMPLEDSQSPRDILSEGQQVQVRVLHVEPSRQRLGFSMLLDNK